MAKSEVFSGMPEVHHSQLEVVDDDAVLELEVDGQAVLVPEISASEELVLDAVEVPQEAVATEPGPEFVSYMENKKRNVLTKLGLAANTDFTDNEPTRS
jgi:hypothetical protein